MLHRVQNRMLSANNVSNFQILFYSSLAPDPRSQIGRRRPGRHGNHGLSSVQFSTVEHNLATQGQGTQRRY